MNGGDGNTESRENAEGKAVAEKDEEGRETPGAT